MDDYAELCRSLGLPVWMSSLLVAARRLRSDVARRRKVYRMLQRKLMFHGVGEREEGEEGEDGEEGSWRRRQQQRITYVYPEQVKTLVRSVFPQDVCDYPDPAHPQVVLVTMDDLHRLS